MPKRLKVRLPNKILALPNADKAFHEKWYKGRRRGKSLFKPAACFTRI